MISNLNGSRSYQTQVSLQGTGSEPLGLGLSSSVENGNSLACLRNAGSHSAESYGPLLFNFRVRRGVLRRRSTDDEHSL